MVRTRSSLAPTGESDNAYEDTSEVIVVTGTRIEKVLDRSLVATEVIPRSDLVRSGARNVAEALQSKAGVRITPDVTGAVQVSLRGFNADQVLVLIDGQRIAGRKNGAIDLTRLGVERVERIEIVKGPGSAVYGADALGGVVNIITRRARKGIEGSLRLSYGAAPEEGSPSLVTAESAEAAGRLAGRTDDFDWQAVGSYRRRGGFDLSPDTIGTTAARLDDFDTEVSAGTCWDEVCMRLRLEGGTRGTSAIGAGPILPQGQQAIFDRTQRINTYGGYLHGQYQINKNQSLVLESSLSVYEETFRRAQRQTSNVAVENLNDILGTLHLRYVATVADDHQLLVGIEGFVQELDSTRNPDFTNRLRFSAILQDEWSIAPNFEILGGVRLDVDSQFGAFPTPRVAIRYQPFSFLISRVSWGIGFKAPLPRDIGIVFENPGAGYRVAGNPNLRPETTSTWTGSLHLRPHDVLKLDFEAYRSDARDLIEALPGQEGAPGELLLFTFGNVTRARIQGVESAVTFRPTSFVRFNVAYEFLDARNLVTNDVLPNRAPHRVTTGVGFNVPAVGLDFDLRGVWTDARVFALGELRIEAPSYTRLDARVDFEINDNFNVFGGADNILDAGDPTLLAIAPRTIFVGLQSAFD